MKLKSDSKFLEFLKGKKSLGIVLVALVGAVLIFISGSKEVAHSEESLSDLSRLCSSVEGVGECRAVINYGDDGEVVAVAVLCEGAQSDEVRLKLYKLISSLYGLGYNRISVLKISE